MMDRRSWPWKKKSEKAVVLTDSVGASSLPNSGELQTKKDDGKHEKYIQIKMESYTHLIGLEDQVKILTEKLLLAESEIATKGNLAKQHAKVAEEAVSGWEKAEAEALALKQHTESVTLLKLSAEERALHLDSALKECMKQVRNVKEESEQKLHDVVFTRTKQWEMVKVELDSRISVLGHELQKASAENAVLSRSLQERSNLLKKVSEEKSQADVQIEVLKNDISSCEREISSLKYELHVISKELEIRNEEKNMSMRSAEVANKQHLEDVKKIMKLDAECQRLRGLVRKKLPGPAALAQMKLEVEHLDGESGQSRLRKSSAKSSNPHHILPSDIELESIRQVHKENGFLNARLFVMEEEMKLLKEALSKRNDELQVSREMCARQANKLHSTETHLLVLSKQKDSSIPNTEFRFGNESNPPSLTSLSEDGFGEEVSVAESCPTAPYSDLSHSKNYDAVNKPEKSNSLGLMDDFLEMERLASLSTETNGNINMSSHFESDKVGPTHLSNSGNKGYSNIHKCADSELSDLTSEHASNEKDLPLLLLKSRITAIFDSQAQGTTAKNIIEDLKHIVLDAQEKLLKEQIESIDDLAEQKHCHRYIQEITDNETSLNHDNNICTKAVCVFDQELKDAISHIYEFVLSLGKGDVEIPDISFDLLRVGEKIEGFFATIDSFKCNEVSLHDFILSLSHVLCETIDLGYKMRTEKVSEGESYGSDCIDKETLLENKVALHEESLSGASSLIAHASHSPEFQGSIGDGIHIKTALPILNLEDFNELKLEKDKMEMDLVRCKEMLTQTNATLVETEQQLSELKLELASCQKSKSLVATQLKCMVESYKILESQKEEVEAEISRLHAEVETLNNELQEERLSHQEDKGKYNELQEHIERNLRFSASSFPSNANGMTTQQGIWTFSREDYKLKYVTDAGGENVDPTISNHSYNVSNPDDMDDFYALLCTVDMVIDQTYASEPAEYGLSTFLDNCNVGDDANFDFLRNQSLWRFDKRVQNSSVLDWYDGAISQPQLVLADLIEIFFPTGNYPLTYFRNIAKNEGVITVGPESCNRSTSAPLDPSIVQC